MKLSVIILNWNGKNLLKRFLPSVVEFTSNFDIYLVDNNSEDDSIEFSKNNFPDINIIKLSKNYGYSEGYNIAIKQIESDIYCFLNSDVRVTENWTKPIIKIFKNNPLISIIQPKILDEKKPEKFEYSGAAGGFIDKFGYPYCRGRIFNTTEIDKNQYHDREIFWASGACFFVRSKNFKDLGGFDTNFFAHMEEIDFCWRNYNHGGITYYTNSSKVYHLGGQSLKSSNPRKTFLNFRNNLLTITKNTPSPLLLIIICRLFLDGLAGIKFLIEGKPNHMFSILRAHLSYYKNLILVLKFRYNNKTRKIYNSEFSVVLKYYVFRVKSFMNLTKH